MAKNAMKLVATFTLPARVICTVKCYLECKDRPGRVVWEKECFKKCINQGLEAVSNCASVWTNSNCKEVFINLRYKFFTLYTNYACSTCNESLAREWVCFASKEKEKSYCQNVLCRISLSMQIYPNWKDAKFPAMKTAVIIRKLFSSHGRNI